MNVYSLLQILCLLSLSVSHLVVFEDVGQVAVSTNYLHAIVPLNVTGVRQLIQDYLRTLDHVISPDTRFYNKMTDTDYDHHTRYYFGQHFRDYMDQMVMDFKSFVGQLRHNSNDLTTRLNSILHVLPKHRMTSVNYHHSQDVIRAKRFVPLLLGALTVAKGVFGTFMGLYNHRQLKQLQQELQGSIRDQRRLIALAGAANAGQPKMSTLSEKTNFWTHKFRLFSGTAIFSILSQQKDIIEVELRRIQAAIQQAHHRRLAIDLLSPPQLASLFDALSHRAAELGSELLLERPSDLFQIEASYTVDGDDFTLVVHVPIAARNTLLRLYRFHPFPLSFSKTHFLVPHSRHQLFAISPDISRLGLDLTEADLEGCYRLNGLYLCERLGVLQTRLARTCLGALYDQKFKAALALCEMDLEPVGERVLQLSNNWFLIYANSSFTAGVRCRNHTSNEVHLKTGINKIHVSPSCQVQLQQHHLFSDTALRTTTDIKEFEWDLEDHAFSDEEVQEANEILEMIEPEGANKPTLAAVRRQTAQSKRSPRWLWFFIVIGCLVFIGLLLAGLAVLYSRKWWILRRAVKLLIHRVWISPTDPPVTTRSAGNIGQASEPQADRPRPAERTYRMRPSRCESSDSPHSSPGRSKREPKKKKSKLKTSYERALMAKPPRI